MSDPFYLVKGQVEQSLQGISTLFQRWRELLQSTNTAASEEFRWHTQEIEKALQTIKWDLQDLQEANEAAAKVIFLRPFFSPLVFLTSEKNLPFRTWHASRWTTGRSRIGTGSSLGCVGRWRSCRAR